jgi:hypothetical protein
VSRCSLQELSEDPDLIKRQLLASKFHQIGKAMLKEPDSTRPGDVVSWLQKAFSLADQLEDAVAPGVVELKVRGSQCLPDILTVDHGTIRYLFYEHSVLGCEQTLWACHL